MVKPIVLTCSVDAANAVSRLNVVIADAAGGVKAEIAAANGTASLGVATTDKDSENNVGVLMQGLIDMPAAAATYNFGDKIGCNSSGVKAYSSGVVLGTVAEPSQKIISTTYSSTDRLKVYINIDGSSLA